MPEPSRRLGSVRARITLIAAVVVMAVLVLAGTLLVVTQRAGVVDQIDERLELDAEQFVEAAAAGDVAVTDVDDDDRLVVVVADGAVVAASDLDPEELAALREAANGTATIDGEPYRVAREREGGVEAVVASSLEDVDDTVGGLVRTLALVVPAATLLLAAVVWLLVGRTLRPVERIRREVDEIGLDELHRRVPEPGGHDEIARLATTMNAMLDRLDRSSQRQRRFVADASHELRTPLTRMRAELELDERDPAAIDHASTRRSALEEVRTLQRLIDDLLLLARRDAGAAPPARELVDLDDLVLEEARTAEGIDVTGVSAAQVSGDPAALRRVVRNLVDNARHHAAGRIAVKVGEEGTTAVLTVDDDGPGIPVERRQEAFERFARLDDARTAGAGHAGLGLAIVADIVAQHGGTVEVADSPLGGARLRVAIPRS